MSDGDAEETSTRPLPARPTAPKLSGRRQASSRPARPGSRAVLPAEEELPEVEPPPEPEPVIAETVVIAPPEPVPVVLPKPKRPPVNPGSAAFRQTLLPPCVVLAVGCLIFGSGYFLQPADSALRQFSPGVPIALIALGLACAITAGVLRRSLRRIDSPRSDS